MTASIVWTPLPTEGQSPSLAFLRAAFNEDAFFGVGGGPLWGATTDGATLWTTTSAETPTWSEA
jgi:hypothetical protein